MKSILLSLVVLLTATSNVENETFPTEFYGVWQSIDNEFLRIQSNFNFETEFLRVKGREMLASGNLSSVGGRIYVIRKDIDKQYTLAYTIFNNTMIVEKPDSHRVWVFTKVGN